jgi:hypothetical protein
MSDTRIKIHLGPQAKRDIESLARRASQNPGGRDEQLLDATILMIHRLDGRRPPTKPLDFDPRFADLSDCDTTYVGADPNEKPPLRIVSQDSPSSTKPGLVWRDIIVVGPRQDSRVYEIAGERLGRPVGVSFDDLAPELQAPRISRYLEPSRQVSTFEPTLSATSDGFEL